MLKWHKDGCYAVGFGFVETEGDGAGEKGGKSGREGEDEGSNVKTQESERREGREGSGGNDLVQRTGSRTVTMLERNRDRKARNVHWLAAGSKDGKISLWDVY